MKIGRLNRTEVLVAVAVAADEFSKLKNVVVRHTLLCSFVLLGFPGKGAIKCKLGNLTSFGNR